MNLSKLHRELKSNDAITFGRRHLNTLSIEGVIPFIMKNKNKVYNYNDVYQALYREGYIKNTSMSAPLLPKLGEVSSSPENLNQAKIYLTFYKGKLANQAYDLKAGTLVRKDEVEQKAFITTRVLRDQLLTLPERLAGELSCVDDIEQVKQILHQELKMILAGLSVERLIA